MELNHAEWKYNFKKEETETKWLYGTVATVILKKTQTCDTEISSSKILCTVFFYNLVPWTNNNFEGMVRLKPFPLFLHCTLLVQWIKFLVWINESVFQNYWTEYAEVFGFQGIFYGSFSISIKVSDLNWNLQWSIFRSLKN